MTRFGAYVRRIIVSVLELAGFVSFVAGWWLLAPWLGLVVGGLVAVVVAFAVEQEADR